MNVYKCNFTFVYFTEFESDSEKSREINAHPEGKHQYNANE